MRFRLKPVEIEARRFEDDPEDVATHIEELTVWVRRGSTGEGSASHDGNKIYIHTYDGDTFKVRRGDWIVRDSANRFYPCTHRQLHEKYEPVAGSAQ